MSHAAAAIGSLVGHEWDPTDDPHLNRPFIDVDELRDQPVAHRYVHGGFAGTDTRFSFYFPPSERYEGRFFQHVTPVPQSENLAPNAVGEQDKLSFSVASGAYFVETNGGGPGAANPFSGIDPTIGAYRANAAAAQFSRSVANLLYGEHRPFGYLYGGSGGGYRTIGSAENTDGVWDGFVPYVIGSPMAIPNVFSVRMHAQRSLRDAFGRIVDAYDAGGDPAALELSGEEREAFDEVTRMGFPPRSWFGWRTMGMHAFGVLYPGVMMADPSYAAEFWSEPGHLGADPTSSVHRDRIQLETTVAEVLYRSLEDGPLEVSGGVDESFASLAAGDDVASGFRLATAPTGWVLGAELHVLDGAAAGQVLRLLRVDGDCVVVEPGQDATVLASVAVGCRVRLDNSSFLAAQTYHRHQVPGADYPVWDQFRGGDGAPLFPQRPMLVGPAFTKNASGTVPTGRIGDKMIVVACLLDREAYPWQADWYRQQVAAHVGDAVDDTFRLWFIDNALHGDYEAQEFPTRTVSYVPALQAALRQLVAWVERGEEPAPSTDYAVVDGQVHLGADITRRGGVQPAVSVSVNAGETAVVRPGEPVNVRVAAQAVAGVVVAAIADLSGSGDLDTDLDVTPGRSVVVDREVVFQTEGVHFIAVRVSAQADGDPADPHARVHNIARARVIVASQPG